MRIDDWKNLLSPDQRQTARTLLNPQKTAYEVILRGLTNGRGFDLGNAEDREMLAADLTNLLAMHRVLP